MLYLAKVGILRIKSIPLWGWRRGYKHIEESLLSLTISGTGAARTLPTTHAPWAGPCRSTGGKMHEQRVFSPFCFTCTSVPTQSASFHLEDERTLSLSSLLPSASSENSSNHAQPLLPPSCTTPLHAVRNESTTVQPCRTYCTEYMHNSGVGTPCTPDIAGAFTWAGGALAAGYVIDASCPRCEGSDWHTPLPLT